MNHTDQTNPLYDMSMDQVADALSINRVTVSMVQARAIQKFKAELERRGIKYDDLLTD